MAKYTHIDFHHLSLQSNIPKHLFVKLADKTISKSRFRESLTAKTKPLKACGHIKAPFQ
ncbi:MAG: hypothetical protein WCH01_06365 [Methylococcaceae bacterium]